MTERVKCSPRGFAAELAAAYVGFAPMRGDELARGKCAYKSIQYEAAALPIVGSPAGTKRHVIDEDARDRVRARLLSCSIRALLWAHEDMYDQLLTRGRQG
jgi:hypothetical protein